MDDAQRDALLDEARELDRELVDYVIARLDQVALTRAIEQRIGGAVRSATGSRFDALAASLGALRGDLARIADRQMAASVPSQTPTPLRPLPPDPVDAPRDLTPRDLTPGDFTSEPPAPAVGTEAPFSAEPVRPTRARLFDRIDRSWLPWSIAMVLAVSMGGATYWAWDAEARLTSACAKARTLGDRLDKGRAGLDAWKGEEAFRQVLAAAPTAGPRVGGSAAGNAAAPAPLPLPVRMARAIDGQLSDLSGYSAEARAVCDGASAPAVRAD